MDRQINVRVRGSYLSKDANLAGVQHEANAKVLRIEFDESWSGYAKKVTFWNAKGLVPVVRTLTTDLLEDAAASTNVYLCPIPGEAMTEAGWMTFCIDGWQDGKRQRSLSDHLEVKAAPNAADASEAADPTPTQMEQMQAQYEAIMADIQGAAQAADSKEAAAASAAKAESYAQQTEGIAESAQAWAQMAQAEAERATVPAVEGVYNIVLTDRKTGERYALIVENGVLSLLGVNYDTATEEPVLIDNNTGTAYQLMAEGGVLKLMEV